MMRKSWKPKPIAGAAEGLVLFDGVCVLCSGWVRFLIARDRDYFTFTPIQSPYGLALAHELDIDPTAPETNALIINGQAYFKGDSALQALARLPGWRWVRALWIVPRPLRDWVYDRVARNRYRLFGKTESCMVPSPDIAARFVHDRPAR